MTFLPIVDRELRVAARKRSTFWLRVIAALVTIAISGAFLGIGGLMEMQGGMFPLSLGAVLFAILTWLTFVCVCSAGIFFSSDCLSEEKREGTLGLLFLTDLRGYDVVLGKLMAVLLRTLYALLAIFPVVAITLLMGGVTGVEFWKKMLLLVNALFFSLAAGMFVSSVSRESQRAMAGTLILLLFFFFAVPAIDEWIADVKQKTPQAFFSYASPWLAFAFAGTSQMSFWWSFAVPNCLGWLFLILAAVFTPRAFHEKSATGAASKRSWFHTLRFGTERGRARRRTRLLEINPALWLANRSRWRSLSLWGVIFGAIALTIFFNLPIRKSLMGDAVDILRFLVWAIYLWVAVQSSKFFVDAWRNGTLDLLLTSPLPEKQIIRGQWHALLRLFFLPALVVIGGKLALALQQVWESYLTAVSANATFPSYLQWQLAFTFLGAITAVADLIALAWFGMWMGLTTRRPTIAVLKTVLFVLVVPLLVGGVLTMYCTMLSVFVGGRVMWLPFLIFSSFWILKNIYFTVWAHRRLHTRFRAVAAGTVRPVWTPRAAMLPQANLPPVIPSEQSERRAPSRLEDVGAGRDGARRSTPPEP